VDDPFFAAHNFRHAPHVPIYGQLYYPDYEATAIGCTEQFQYCLRPPDGRCWPWSVRITKMPIVGRDLLDQDEQDLSSIAELLLSYSTLPVALSVFDHLSYMAETNDLLPLRN